ncbi:MAG: energy-coupling factor transporter ATPase [Eubacteriales bacterium]|nr:energy-coupling factor transporter ATPase [Eubacteriales bacterium]
MGLKLENVSYKYEQGTAMEVAALDNVSVEIPDGQFIGLIGHTGSGKSTFVQMLNGLLRATQGHVYYDGEDIDGENFDRKGLRANVGLVFQYPEHQLFETDVVADVMFGPRNLGLSEEECRARALEALNAVGMPERFYEQSPFDLSGGQKRRAAIAGVLAMHPKVLVLDEPTAGLDPKGRDEILELISAMHRERRMTILLVSHSMEDVARYVDRIMVMNHGKLIFDDAPRGVFAHYRELEEIGLAAPQMTYIMQYLKEKGMPVRTDVLTVEEAAAEILQYV